MPLSIFPVLNVSRETLELPIFIFDYHENNLATEATEATEKKQKNQCNLRNLWFLFFIRLRARLPS